MLILVVGLLIHLLIDSLRDYRKAQSAPTDAALIQATLKAQHRADSVQALLAAWQQQRRIDSLTLLLLHRHALDSMRAHARLSDLDAMRKLNGAIQKR